MACDDDDFVVQRPLKEVARIILQGLAILWAHNTCVTCKIGRRFRVVQGSTDYLDHTVLFTNFEIEDRVSGYIY